jgi:hypothetical protein
MTFALSALISIGPVALVAALVSIVIYYFKYRYAPSNIVPCCIMGSLLLACPRWHT